MAIASSSRQTRRRAPARRPLHRYKPIKLGKKRWAVRALLAGGLAGVILVGWAVVARRLVPTANTSRDHFDAIVVLGYPADGDGNPTPEELARVSEAVREYERGIASRLLFTGGPAHNQFVEADVMAGAAAAQGIPPSAIFVETKATDTIQNACYSARIMQAHGWHSAEVVSSAYHLPRAGMIFSHTPLDWRLHAAPPLQPGASGSKAVSALEILKTMRYLVYARWTETCEP
ncbi:MAG TPA: YdcF family protein [Terracidiphilus sp.]|nr:YdcF family protein [Terracidiphilus sp.]